MKIALYIGAIGSNLRANSRESESRRFPGDAITRQVQFSPVYNFRTVHEEDTRRKKVVNKRSIIVTLLHVLYLLYWARPIENGLDGNRELDFPVIRGGRWVPGCWGPTEDGMTEIGGDFREAYGDEENEKSGKGRVTSLIDSWNSPPVSFSLSDWYLWTTLAYHPIPKSSRERISFRPFFSFCFRVILRKRTVIFAFLTVRHANGSETRQVEERTLARTTGETFYFIFRFLDPNFLWRLFTATSETCSRRLENPEIGEMVSELYGKWLLLWFLKYEWIHAYCWLWVKRGHESRSSFLLPYRGGSYVIGRKNWDFNVRIV